MIRLLSGIRLRCLLAGLVTVSLLGGLGWGANRWLQSQEAHYRQAKQQYQAKAAHYRALIGARSRVAKRLKELSMAESGSPLLLSAGAPNLAQNELRKLVEGLAEDHGAHLDRTRNLPQNQKGELTRVSIQVRMEAGDLESLRDMFYQLESRKPLVILSQLSLRRYRRSLSDRNGRGAKDPISIAAQFRLSGFMRESS